LTTPIRAICADDEVLGRLMIRNLIGREKDFVLVAECQSGVEVVASIAEYQPDVVFLDVQMPEMDGLEVIASLSFERRPLVVLVTAYERHAVEAFSLRVFDYLVKPVKNDRFSETVRHLRVALENRLNTDPDHLQNETNRASASGGDGKRYLTVRAGDQILHIRPDEVSAFEAENQYVRLRTKATSYLVSTESLNSLQDCLDPEAFVRIHRATLVNVNRVTGIAQLPAGRRAIVTDSGHRYPVSRRNLCKMEAIFESLSRRRTPAPL
jgi:two-component system, LytTR family, response regulator